MISVVYKDPIHSFLLISSGKKLLRATFDYTAINDDELTLKVGDIVEFLADEEEGWYKGQLKGKVGVFPSNFVEEATQSAVPVGVTSTDGKHTHSASVSDLRPSKPPPPIPSDTGPAANHHHPDPTPHATGEVASGILCRNVTLLAWQKTMEESLLVSCRHTSCAPITSSRFTSVLHACPPHFLILLSLPPPASLALSTPYPSLSLHSSLPSAYNTFTPHLLIPHLILLPASSPVRPSATFGGKQVLPMGELPMKPSDLKKRPPPQPGRLDTRGITWCACCSCTASSSSNTLCA